jgi:hypothetical protein
MPEYEPQIIELEPEKAPRTTAIILLVCGLMGVGFLMVNVFFTGEDPFQSTSWPDEEDGNIQERGNILPNVWRARGEDDEQEEVDDQINARKVQKPTTNPYAIPGVEQYMKRPSIVPPPGPGVKPVVPGMPNPNAPGRAAPGAPANPAPGK